MYFCEISSMYIHYVGTMLCGLVFVMGNTFLEGLSVLITLVFSLTYLSKSSRIRLRFFTSNVNTIYAYKDV